MASDRGEFGLAGEALEDVPSVEECAQKCELDERCFQYSYHDGICGIGMSVRYGDEKMPDEGGNWSSGWNLTRLATWISEQEPCGRITYPIQGPE